MTYLTIRSKLATNKAAPINPAMITCPGFILTASASCSVRLRTPRNDQNTARATCNGEASRRGFIAISTTHAFTRAAPVDLEERE